MVELRKAGVVCFDSSRNTPDRENALDRLDPEMVEHRHFALFRPTLLSMSQRLAFARGLPLYRRIRQIAAPRKSRKINAQWQSEPKLSRATGGDEEIDETGVT
jgi:hypothetical protein